MPPKMSKASALRQSKDKEKKQKVDSGSIEELNLKIETLEAEKKAEQESRSLMQLERDKIQSFWDINKKELDSLRAELRNNDREMEELQEQQQIELKVYKQKAKHLMYKHQENIAALKADEELLVIKTAEAAGAWEQELLKDKRALQLELREQAAAHGETLRVVRLEHAKQAAKLRQEVQAGARALADKYELRTHAAAEEAEARRRAEAQDMQEANSAHVQELLSTHERELADIKAYYNAAVADNLAQMKALKEEAAEARRARAAADRAAADVSAQNRQLVEPLAQAQRLLETQAAALEGQQKERAAAAVTKSRLAGLQARMRALEWEHEVLLQKYAALDRERVAVSAGERAAAEEAHQATAAGILLRESGRLVPA